MRLFRVLSSRLGLRLGLLLLTAGCLAVVPANASDQPQFAPLAGCERLKEKAPNSTFVLYLPGKGSWGACNPERAAQPFLPASTYKVPHALIGLETGTVKDEHANIEWDGVKRAIPAWNADTSLASGMRNSTVWFYQNMARRIGWETMNAWVRKLGYGNMDIGDAGDIGTFWLLGELRISAIEEVRFLDRLRRKKLPASPGNQEKVKRMMEIDRSASGEDLAWVMYAKTGAVLPISSDRRDLVKGATGADLVKDLDQVGWIVGWIERPGAQGGDAVFALNLAIDSPDALGLRQKLTRELLAANGILPASSPSTQ